MPTRRATPVVYVLILANVLAFIWVRALIAAHVDTVPFLRSWALVPGRFMQHPLEDAITVVTHMFLHDPTTYLHLGGNMLFLWIFGDNVEEALGSLRFLLFYLLCGVAAAFAQIVVNPGSPIMMLGASGAISGVLAAYGSLYPRAAITVINPVPLLWLFWGLFFDLPAWIVILEYFVVNLFNALFSVDHRSGGVAFYAHLGGFVAGLFLVRLFMIGREATPYDRWSRFTGANRRAQRRREW